MNKQPSSRTCFVCGRENNIGLKMDWYNNSESQQICSEVTVSDDFNGYPGVVHGGIVAAILDETAGRALMLSGDINELFITTSLEVKYHQPTPTGQPLHVVGWVIKRNNRFAHVAAEIRLADGTLTAKCKATVARPPQIFVDRTGWKDEAEHWRVYE